MNKIKLGLIVILMRFYINCLTASPIPGINSNLMSLHFGGLLSTGKSSSFIPSSSGYRNINTGSVFGFAYTKRTYTYNYHLGINYLNEGYMYTIINSKETPLNKLVKSNEVENKFISLVIPMGLSYTVSESRTSTVDIGFALLPKLLMKQIQYIKINYENDVVEKDVFKRKSEYSSLSLGLNVFASIEIPINYDYSVSVIPNLQFNHYGSSKPDFKSNLLGFGVKVGLNLIN